MILLKCQRCGVNEANISYTQIINGDKLKLYLCDRCAHDMKIGPGFAFDFNDIFGAFFDEPKTLQEKTEVLACSNCGTTFEEFAKTGMLGCEKCYHFFENRLDNILKRLHGANHHVAEKNVTRQAKKKVTIKKSIKELIEDLKEELKLCIQKEEYEKAAVIRDKIKELEKELTPKERGE